MLQPRQPVIVGLSGGLGNQLFQYAAGRSLAAQISAPLVLDLSWFRGQKLRKFSLSSFQIKAAECSQFQWLPSYSQAQISRFSRRFLPRIMGVPVLRETHFHYNEKFSKINGPVYLEGYWQSEFYFKEIRHLLLKDFTLNHYVPNSNLEMLSKINNGCDAICVHVRRGDYISNSSAAKIYGECSPDYFHRGVTKLSNELNNPHCFVFSDDYDWVRSNLKFSVPTTIVDINGQDAPEIDLVLMSNCHHFLIANSSFSWWAAWLAKRANKKIIAPEKWFLNADINTKDLIPSSWQRL